MNVLPDHYYYSIFKCTAGERVLTENQKVYITQLTQVKYDKLNPCYAATIDYMKTRHQFEKSQVCTSFANHRTDT